MSPDPAAEPLPITIIGGYLGAGKTTLLNALLTEPHGQRFAVLVNDFGAVNIDAALIASHAGDTMALTNGCICCSITDGFGDALTELRNRRTDFDHVLIEVSGVGDPWKVAQWGRSPGFELDAVVVLADAETITDQATDRYIGDTVTTQLRGADVVVLTKLDLIDAATATAVRTWLTGLSPATVVDGPASFELLIGAGHDAAATIEPVPHPEHTTRQIALPADITLDDLEAWLERRPAAVLRAKGIVHTANGPRLVQVVGRRCEFTKADGPASDLIVIMAPHADQAAVDTWTQDTT